MSSEKTLNLQLHKWVGSDLVKREEFNDNFQSLDKEGGKIRNQERLLANHEAWFSIDGRATPNSGKIIDLIDGNCKVIDLTKASSNTSLTAGTTSITVTMKVGLISDFKVGQEVTIIDDTNQEDVNIFAVDTTNNILTVSSLANSYKERAIIARTTADYDTENQVIKVGGYGTSEEVSVQDATVVNSAYDTSGNGGRKLVQLENGWLVSSVYDSSNIVIYLYVSKDNGATWSQLCYRDTSRFIRGHSLSSYKNFVYLIELEDDGSNYYNNFWTIDAEMVSNVNIGGSTSGILNTDTLEANTQTAYRSCSLAINEAGTELHATWTSKNPTYPNSFNIRYAKATINIDGTVTWGSVEQVTTENNSGYGFENTSIVINSSGNPFISADYAGVSYYIVGRLWDGTSWQVTTIYSNSSFEQIYPSAVFVPSGINGLSQGRLWVAWMGNDSTDTVPSIRVSYSDDGGSTWSSMEKLASGGTAYYQRYPSITANPNNEIFIVWDGETLSSTGYAIRSIKNSNGTWGNIENIVIEDGASKFTPSTLFDPKFSLDFTKPLFIFEHSNIKVSFYGTWIIGNFTPLLSNKVRYNISPIPTTDEVVSWIEKEKGDLTVTADISIVDTASNEIYQPMTKSTTSIDTTSEEDEFIGSVATAEEKVTLKLTLTRTSIENDKAITKVLGAIS